MKLEDFFNSKTVSLPKEGFNDSQETFDQFLNGLFQQYIEQLRSIDDPEFPDITSSLPDLAASAQSVADSIIKSVVAFLSGDVHAAYQGLFEKLSNIDLQPFLSELIGSHESCNLSDPFSPYLLAIQHPPLYRIRSINDRLTFLTRCDLFHVPFERRRFVNNLRYSIAGLPCLYLGSSIWICWEELGRPPLDSIWVSRFNITKPIRVLDFQFPPHHVWGIFYSLIRGTPNAVNRTSEAKLKSRFTQEFLKSYIANWPLVAACSVKRKSSLGSFFPEFIVPQLLLQWVAQENRVDGIRYFSVQMPAEGRQFLGHSNCVFPVKTTGLNGHCSLLKERFALTEPLSWEAMTATNLPARRVITNETSNAFSFIQMNHDITLQYSQTTFFQTELQLEGIEATKNWSRTIDSDDLSR